MEKEGTERTEPQRDEVLVLLDLLNQQILSMRRSKRSLEREMGQGQGYLGSLLKGRITLKVEHLWDLADVVGFEPLVLLFQAAPQEHRDRFLQELKLQEDPEARAQSAMTREEIEDLVKRTVRQELARLATG